MPLRALGPFSSIQLTPPRPDWPDGADLATAEGLTRAPLGGAVGALTNHGGPVIASVKLVALYAGTFWADRAKNDQFLDELCRYGYLTAATPQGVGNGVYVGGFSLPAPAQQALHDSDCHAMIAAALGTNGVPPPDASTLYMLILPSGVSVTFDGTTDSSCTKFCGYHNSTPTFRYAVQTATDCNGCNLGDAFAGFTMVEAHELTEACTDPQGSGWYNDTTGAENADECAWVPLTWGPWTVQGYASLINGSWVNSLGAYTPVSTPSSKHASTTTVSATPNPVAAGAPLLLAVAVAADSGIPTGTCTLQGPDTARGVALDAAGRGHVDIAAPTTPGIYTLRGSYSGDARTLPSAASPLSLTVTAMQPQPDPNEERFWKTVGPYTTAAADARDKTMIGAVAQTEAAWVAHWKRQQAQGVEIVPELPPMPNS